MPPPTRAKSATDEAPKEKPKIVAASRSSSQRTVIPSSPSPTTTNPITAPERKATRSPSARPGRAARRRAHVGAGSDAHADVAGRDREDRADDEGQRAVPGDESHQQRRHDHDEEGEDAGLPVGG